MDNWTFDNDRSRFMAYVFLSFLLLIGTFNPLNAFEIPKQETFWPPDIIPHPHPPPECQPDDDGGDWASFD
jgi:hypothetical protein